MQSFIYCYAKKHNLDYCVQTRVNNPHIYGNDIKIDAYRFPGINYCDSEQLLPIYKESSYTYSEIPKMDNVCFAGFWQSWKYFDEYRDDLLKAFGFDNIETKKNICSIHVRRGDYLKYPEYHPFVGEWYLTRSLIYMTEKGYKKFFVFSDDIEWCKSFFGQEGLFGDLSFEFSDVKSVIEDLVEMASCENNIISNSTFGWWGSYINPNPDKIIIAPKKWFGDSFQHNTKDLYLPEAHII